VPPKVADSIFGAMTDVNKQPIIHNALDADLARQVENR
jgi:hypothetical protein